MYLTLSKYVLIGNTGREALRCYATFNFWKTQDMFDSYQITSNSWLIQYYQQKQWGFCDGTVFCYLTLPSSYIFINLNGSFEIV